MAAAWCARGPGVRGGWGPIWQSIRVLAGPRGRPWPEHDTEHLRVLWVPLCSQTSMPWGPAGPCSPPVDFLGLGTSFHPLGASAATRCNCKVTSLERTLVSPTRSFPLSVVWVVGTGPAGQPGPWGTAKQESLPRGRGGGFTPRFVLFLLFFSRWWKSHCTQCPVSRGRVCRLAHGRPPGLCILHDRNSLNSSSGLWGSVWLERRFPKGRRVCRNVGVRVLFLFKLELSSSHQLCAGQNSNFSSRFFGNSKEQEG